MIQGCLESHIKTRTVEKRNNTRHHTIGRHDEHYHVSSVEKEPNQWKVKKQSQVDENVKCCMHLGILSISISYKFWMSLYTWYQSYQRDVIARDWVEKDSSCSDVSPLSEEECGWQNLLWRGMDQTCLSDAPSHPNTRLLVSSSW